MKKNKIILLSAFILISSTSQSSFLVKRVAAKWKKFDYSKSLVRPAVNGTTAGLATWGMYYKLAMNVNHMSSKDESDVAIKAPLLGMLASSYAGGLPGFCAYSCVTLAAAETYTLKKTKKSFVLGMIFG